jgi:hypothetical protein
MSSMPIAALARGFAWAKSLLRAYDDNRELGSDFHLHRFRHVARWKDAERAVEMQPAQPHRAVTLDRSTPIPFWEARPSAQRARGNTIAKASARSRGVRAGACRRPGRTTSGCSACSRSPLRPGGVRADVSLHGVAAKPQATAAAGLARVTLPARNRRDYDDMY